MRWFAVVLWMGLSGMVLAEEPPTVKTEVYKKTPQGELNIHLHFPPGWKATDQRPTIVFFFGGGWRNGSVGQFETQATYLASRGMVTARADYRVKSRHQVLPPACVEDAKSAVRWLRSHATELGIDPNRIVAAGGSAGGHIAACTSLTTGLEAEGEDLTISSRPNLLVLFNPVLNLTSVRAATREQFFKELGEEATKQISPTLYLAKETPPTLLLYGTDDWALQQGEEYQQQAKQLGHRTELFTAKGQPHGFFNRSPWKERTLLEVDKFLQSVGYLEGMATLKVPQ